MPEAIEREFTTPEFRGWRYRPVYLNGGWLVPNKVATQFTEVEMAKLVTWATSNGLTVGERKPTGIRVSDQTPGVRRLDLNDYGAPGLKNEAYARREQERRNQLAERERAEAEAFAAARSRAFILATFGDDFANDYNKCRLVEYLEGKSKRFTGLTSWKWQAGFDTLGIETTGKTVDEILTQLRDRFRVEADHA